MIWLVGCLFVTGIIGYWVTKTSNHRLVFPIEALVKNFVLTKDNEVWVGYQLNHQTFPLNDLDFFKEYNEDGKGLFEHTHYDYHLVDNPTYFHLSDHIEKTIKHMVHGPFADLGAYYFRLGGKILEDEVQMNEHHTYLFIRLTAPPQVASPLDFFPLLKEVGFRFMVRLTGQTVPKRVLLSDYRQAEKQLYQDLSNYKAIERLDPVTCGRLVYYQFHRADRSVPQRALTIEEMTEGIVENHKGYLTVEQLDKTHYLAFLGLIDMPASMFGSGFIANLRESVSFSLETHQRLRFNHEQKDIREAYKRRKRIYKQVEEQDESEGVLDDDEVILFGEERLRDLNETLKRKERRLVYMSVFLVVSADSRSLLEERVKELLFVLEGTDYNVYRPLVDQLTLFNQCLIGSRVTFRSYEQAVTTGYAADFGLDLEKEVGNRYGMPLGRVITVKKIKSVQQALSLSSKMVWFFPSLAKRGIEGALHTNGNTLITGPPGQGKSVLVKYIFLFLTFLGQKILYVDPKNESEGFFRQALETYGDLPEFRALYERIHFISLSEQERYRGLLDPLLFLPREQAIQTARNVLESLGEVTRDPQTANAKKALILDAIETVMKGPGKKHLTQVIEVIRKQDSQLAKLIAGHNRGLGKVLLGNDASDPLRFENQVNVLGTQGLQIPTQAEIDANRLTNEQIAGMAIMEVIMKMTSIFSTDKTEDACIIFDEAKGFENTAQGRFLIDDSLRKGRANATDIYLVTQAFMDYDQEDKKELLSYKFAFRPNQQAAQEKILHFFGMNANSANLQMINELKAGTCLFQDHKGRNQPIAIDVLFDPWLMAISSINKEDEAVQAALALEQEV